MKTEIEYSQRILAKHVIERILEILDRKDLPEGSSLMCEAIGEAGKEIFNELSRSVVNEKVNTKKYLKAVQTLAEIGINALEGRKNDDDD
jgi:hypothetical protein